MLSCDEAKEPVDTPSLRWDPQSRPDRGVPFGAGRIGSSAGSRAGSIAEERSRHDEEQTAEAKPPDSRTGHGSPRVPRRRPGGGPFAPGSSAWRSIAGFAGSTAARPGLGTAGPSGVGPAGRVAALAPGPGRRPGPPRAGRIAGRRLDLGRRAQPRHPRHRRLALRQRADLVRRITTARIAGAQGCVVSKIAEFRAVLADRNAPRARRRQALRFFVHLVQDLHQPMHVADRRDRGGNSLQLRSGRYENTNLHQVWDSGLFRRRYRMRDEPELVDDVRALADRPEARGWTRGRVEDWADESLADRPSRVPRPGDGPDPPLGRRDRPRLRGRQSPGWPSSGSRSRASGSPRCSTRSSIEPGMEG